MTKYITEYLVKHTWQNNFWKSHFAGNVSCNGDKMRVRFSDLKMFEPLRKTFVNIKHSSHVIYQLLTKIRRNLISISKIHVAWRDTCFKSPWSIFKVTQTPCPLCSLCDTSLTAVNFFVSVSKNSRSLHLHKFICKNSPSLLKSEFFINNLYVWLTAQKEQNDAALRHPIFQKAPYSRPKLKKAIYYKIRLLSMDITMLRYFRTQYDSGFNRQKINFQSTF